MRFLAPFVGGFTDVELVRNLLQRRGSVQLLLINLLLCLIPELVNKWAEVDDQLDHLREPFVDALNNSRYDFIIVGVGSAGSVVANRLINSPSNYSVLVLEAGGEQNWITYLPGFDIMSTGYKRFDFRYNSTPQTNSCLSCQDRQFAFPRGKGLGGSSALNFMMYLRGNKKCFDNWANYVNDSSWNSTYTTELFKKHEHYTGKYPNSNVHGCGGELNVDQNRFRHPSFDLFAEAMEDVESRGKFHFRDVNDNQTDSYMHIESTTSNGFRWSTNTAFLSALPRHTNRVQFSKFSFVTELVFDPNNSSKVIGVDYLWHAGHSDDVPKRFRAYANKEVILSAGALNTPQILLQSGIGPEEDMKKYNIELKKNLPVGRNLQDHVTVAFFVVMDNFTSFIAERDLIVDTLFSLPRNPIGWLGGTSILATGFCSTPKNDDPNFPNIQHVITYYGVTELLADVLFPLIRFTKTEYGHLLKNYGGKDGHLILTVLGRPTSTGTVTLNTTAQSEKDYKKRFMANPVIDPNYLSTPEDVENLVDGMRNAIQFFEGNRVYKEKHATFARNGFSSCNEFRNTSSREFIECYVRHYTMNLWHFSGTCKMGPAGDPTAVVDNRLRVHGIHGLRVIDASIMPNITNANTNAPTIMIGEKGAQMIIEDYGGIPYPPRNGSVRECRENEKPLPLPDNSFKPPDLKYLTGLLREAAKLLFGIDLFNAVPLLNIDPKLYVCLKKENLVVNISIPLKDEL